MRARLRHAWQTRTAGERTALLLLAVVLGAAAYLMLVLSGHSNHRRLQAGVAALQVQAATVVQQAAEFERLRVAPPPPASVTDLRTLVETHAAAAGLARALQRIEATDANRVVVVFGAVGFGEWLRWVDSLGAQRVLVEACHIEALPTAGSVSVTATLLRAGGP